MRRQAGFAAVAGANSRVLVLGSLPGLRSIDAGEYYAHPRNAFWRIVEDLFGVPARQPYAERCLRLTSNRIALWDVLRSARRRGSLDAKIDPGAAAVNDFPAFLAGQPDLVLIAFNGRKAAELFRRLASPALTGTLPPSVTLPSTSPAHAAMPYPEKLQRWSLLKDAATS